MAISMMVGQWEKEFMGHAVVCLVVATIFLADITGSGVWFSFMSSHMLNGVFYKDMIAEMGFLDPRAFAERYYVQYPSLTVAIYPPFFYIIEALLFTLFGISTTVAKLGVSLFTLVGASAFLRLLRLWFPLWLSVIGSVLFLLQPSVLFAQKNVMLEMPFLSMSIVALYFLIVATERESHWAAFLAPLFSAVAFLTRQSAVFLIPIWLGWVIFGKNWRLCRSVHFILGAMAGAVIVMPWVVLNFTTGRGHLAHLEFGGSNIWPNSLFYLEHFSEIITLPVLVLCILGVLLLWTFRKRDSYRFAVLWAGSALFFLLPMKLSEYRYAIGLIPALIMLCMDVICRFKSSVESLSQGKKTWVGFVVVLVFFHASPHTVWDSPDIRGFDKAADFVCNDMHCVSVLYDGYHNSNFILHMRMRDKEKRVFVFRASKVVFSTRFHIEMGYHDLIKKLSDFHGLLNRYSIKYIIQEEKDAIGTPANRRLRKWIKGPTFRLVQQFPLSDGNSQGCGNLLVYEYLDYVEKPLRDIELDMPSMGRKISVTF
ncbi:MAG: glycosyltransferase family 39 protein [Thermodesulfobacteriota bacterium]|nr:glycosyltransferase family 39 protein [Thermodesulfobacteriota bacterium]